MRSSRPLVAILLAGAAFTAGCGGTDPDARNAYVAEVQTAQKLYVTRFEQAGKRFTTTSTLDQDRAALDAFARATQTFVTSLKDISPPEEVSDEHARLTAAMVGYAGRVTQARSDLARGSDADRARVRTELSSSVQATQERITKAIAEINAGLQG